MAFQKGQSGNPHGRRLEKLWREALDLALNEIGADGKKKLRAIAEKTVALALDGDMQAILEVANRLDGKPVQAIEASTDVTHYVVRMPVKPESLEDWAEKYAPGGTAAIQ